jgi:hypothetical protein
MTKWRDVLAAAGPMVMQNKTKRQAITRMLKAHPEWSDRRIANSIKILIITDDDLDREVFPEVSVRQRGGAD